jgi:hypothetical protein
MGPLLFTLYINDIGNTVKTCNIHLYADDRVMYSCATSVQQAICERQHDFDSIQKSLTDLKLVLNISKTKLMLFSRSRNVDPEDLHICSINGAHIELVSQYKYLGVLIDDKLSFVMHIKHLTKKLRLFCYIEISHA